MAALVKQESSDCSPSSSQQNDDNMLACAVVYMDKYSGVIFYQCSICEEFIETSLVNSHLQDHFENVSCHICSQQFISVDWLMDHIKKRSCESKPHTVPVSDRLKDNTFVDELFDESVAPEKVVEHLTIANSTYSCSHCEEKFETRSDHYFHLLTHKQNDELSRPPSADPLNTCEETEESADESSTEEDIKTKITARDKKPRIRRTHVGQKIKRFSCEVCGKMFTESGNLKQHIRSHTGEKPYKCTVCGKSFGHASYMRLHMYIHSDERPYQCNLCGRTFRVPSRLSCHMRRHTNTRPHKCEHCDKRFFSSSQLKEHLKTHTDERPYNCSSCDKKFRRRDTLRQHLKLHTGEKPYKCKICDAAFAQIPGLYGHMKSHRECKV